MSTTILYQNSEYIVCIKPAGIISTDDPGGMPEVLRQELNNDKQELFVVHRLDRETAGLMVYAKTKNAAAKISEEIQNHRFSKEYLAVIEGTMDAESGQLDDWLFRDVRKNKTFVVKKQRKGVRDASLLYQVLAVQNGKSFVKIKLLTGRTHQIRVQFASRKHPLVGDKRYGSKEEGPLALWSRQLEFQDNIFKQNPPDDYPWNLFQIQEVE